MLEQLRKVTQAISLAEGLQPTLNVIVAEICAALSVEVCSIYLADREQKQLLLMANQGLNPQCVGQIRLEFSQGLIGLVARKEEPVHLQQASTHPAFRYYPESNEGEFNAFLGVPIIHQRKILGVLVIQQRTPRQFQTEEETFLITLAAQLSAVLLDCQFDVTFEHHMSGTPQNQAASRTFIGVAASSGIAIGLAHTLFPQENLHDIPDRKITDIPAELDKMAAAVKQTLEQLAKMAERIKGKVSEQELSLFDAYQKIIRSKGLADEVKETIKQGFWGPSALRKVIKPHLKLFKTMSDPYLRERASDLEDLANRVLTNYLRSCQVQPDIKPGSIVVANSITASMIAELPIKHIAGLISLKGSSSSHAAILAKALEIPAVMGIENGSIGRFDQQLVILDGYSGEVIIRPEHQQLEQYQRFIVEEKQLAKLLKTDLSLPNATKDGLAIALMVNCSNASRAKKAKQLGVDGVGLYRTEIPFMQLQQFPSEEEQTRIYRQLLKNFKHFPVVVRTLDIGGDKQLDYFPIEEENPFLGWRGVRVTLDHPEIFLVQLRAIFKASVDCQQLKLALPMVSSLDELLASRKLIDRAYAEVRDELKGKMIVPPQVGIILEVPASVFLLENFATHTDFISVGTNDLIQYTMAVDRNNARVKELYSHFQPAIIRQLDQVSRECHRLKLPLQICGEMAADPAAVLLLVGLGYHALSMNIGSLAKVKRALSHYTSDELKSLARQATQQNSATVIKQLLVDSLESKGLGGLIRAGL